MPQLFDTWVGDSGTRSDGHEHSKETDPDEGLDEEVLVQEEEGDDKQADVDDVVRDVDLDPCDDRDDVTDPHEPPRGDTLRIDEEAEAYGVEEYTPSARSGGLSKSTWRPLDERVHGRDP